VLLRSAVALPSSCPFASTPDVGEIVGVGESDARSPATHLLRHSSG
jgi:hypothetical protein